MRECLVGTTLADPSVVDALIKGRQSFSMGCTAVAGIPLRESQ
ncbi:MAG: hypothetical protein QME81_03035 [bacterium]|nr:hypothetical protein [bacterium]